MTAADDAARRQLKALGELIKARRTQAELSLRELAARTNVSNPYLSQIERGLHEPSVRVLKAIAGALNLSAETLLVQAGILEGDSRREAATAGSRLEQAQWKMVHPLLAVRKEQKARPAQRSTTAAPLACAA